MTTPRGQASGTPIVAVLGAVATTALDAALLALALGGIGPLLGHRRALALLALWGVGAIVLAWLRPVRSHDPIEVRPDPKYALPAFFLIPLVTPPLSALGERAGLWPLPGGAALRWAGVGVSAAGFALRIVAIAQLGSRFSPLVAVQRSHALETRGLYAHVRHPGYLGAWLICLGSMLAFGSGVTLPLVVLMWLLLFSRARREDRMLEQHFGEEFRRYCARTGRFLPRLIRAGAR